MGFLLGVGVGGAVVLVLVGVGHFCMESCTFSLGLDGVKERNNRLEEEEEARRRG